MKTSSKNIIIFIIVFAVSLAALYGIREFRLNNARKAYEYNMEGGLLVEPVTYKGQEYLIPPTDIYDSGLSTDSIPAINDPVYTTVADADNYLSDEVYGIDVVVNGDHRFYSFQILNWHYVVNDEFNGKKIAITHCPLCLSSVVYESELDGQEISLSAGSKIYNNNALLTDGNSDSLWLQMRGLAISGEEIGSQLEVYPSTVISWGAWKNIYPYGEVLSTETGFDRDYARHPYTNYDTAQTIYFPINETTDALSAKWWVTGVKLDTGYIAFSKMILKGRGVVNEDLDGQRVAAFYNSSTEEVFILKPALDDLELTFSYDFETNKITDDQTGSTWLTSGYAVSGELQGSQLERIPSQNAFWFCWFAMHPDTILSEVDLHPEQIEFQAPETTQIEVEI